MNDERLSRWRETWGKIEGQMGEGSGHKQRVDLERRTKVAPAEGQKEMWKLYGMADSTHGWNRLGQ